MTEPHPAPHPLQAFLSVGFDRSLEGLTLVSVDDGQAVLTIEVVDSIQNPVGTLHGGAIATLVDDAGTLAIMSADRDSRSGVTTDLNVSYFKAALPGQTVTITAKALKTGKTLAFVEVNLTNPDGALLAQGRMTKFMG